MTPASVPGGAGLLRALDRLVLIQDVALHSGERETRVDAVLDTGATRCVIPHQEAERLGFAPENRLGFYRVRGVGGVIAMDRHLLEFVQVESPLDFISSACRL